MILFVIKTYNVFFLEIKNIVKYSSVRADHFLIIEHTMNWFAAIRRSRIYGLLRVT